MEGWVHGGGPGTDGSLVRFTQVKAQEKHSECSESSDGLKKGTWNLLTSYL